MKFFLKCIYTFIQTFGKLICTYFCLLTPSVNESIEFLLVSLGLDMVGFSCMSWFLGGSSLGETVIDLPTTGILLFNDTIFEAPTALFEDTWFPLDNELLATLSTDGCTIDKDEDDWEDESPSPLGFTIVSSTEKSAVLSGSFAAVVNYEYFFNPETEKVIIFMAELGLTFSAITGHRRIGIFIHI